MGTTQQVASFVTKTRYEDIPKPAIDMAKLCLLDVIGCALHGSTQPAAKIMLEVVEELGGAPRCQVLGTRLRTNAVNAAMVNGMLGHLDDFDDMGNGHHATLLMPVTLALGEERRVTGKDALTAYLIGLDVTANTNTSLGGDHYSKGWHQTSTGGTLGCTAVASRLLGLSEMQTRMALGIASSQAGGIRAAFGTMTKSMHPANAARAGVLAAKLAARGFQGNPDVIEDRFGFFAAFGEHQAQLGSLTRNLGSPWAIMGRGRDVARGIIIKRWPSCGITHATATVLLRLLQRRPFKADEVESVEVVTTHNPAVMAANIRRPKTPLEGKFSPWYTVASIIVDGKLDLSTFTQAAFDRPVVQELVGRVSIAQDREMAGRPHRTTGGERWWDVTVKLKSGETIVADRLEGHGDVYRWEDREAVYDKFRSLAGTVLSSAQAEAVREAVMTLDESTDVSTLAGLLAPAVEREKVPA